MAFRLFCWLGLFSCVAGCASPSGTQPADAGTTPNVDAGPTTCTQPFDRTAALAAPARGLHFSELLSSNDGVNVDELGETDDWLELVNDGVAPVQLGTFALSDASGKHWKLPDLTVPPGQVILLWADDDQTQGVGHLGVKLSASGEQLTLWSNPCTPMIDRVEMPAMPDNESFARLGTGSAFVRCRYATPGRLNGASCEPPAPPALPPEDSFQLFRWPSNWPAAPSPLSINELSLRPAAFVEVLNTSQVTLTLSNYTLQLAATSPALPFPLPGDGTTLAWPVATLAPGERVLVPVTAQDTAPLEASATFEGVAVISEPGASLVDRVEFNEWPSGAVLARLPDGRGPHTLCTGATPGVGNACTPLTSRPLADRAHALHTAGDFAALTAGGTESGQLALKFLVDLSANDAVHFINNTRWALHYTFVRERVYLEPPLDRCDEAQNLTFNQGWYAFSEREYFKTPDRRFLLGTLVKYTNGVQTVEYTPGDEIDAAQMQRAFRAVVERTDNPRDWSLRPADASQAQRMRALEGTLPIVDRNAPFADLTYQPLTRAEGFGVLRYVSGTELASTALGPDTIVITDDVPNDVPLVSGLITEAFQAPLAHVNVLSEARGTPNMALRGARENPKLKPLIGKLVRLEVGPQDFSVREASAEEADAFWQTRRPSGPRLVPPGDVSQRALVSLSGRGLSDLPAVGAKAAQFAELYRVVQADSPCDSPLAFQVPVQAFAVPMVHYDEHFTASGARALLTSLLANPQFRADSTVRTAGLASVRSAIMGHPVESGLLSQVSAMVRERFGEQRVRFRSSSNTEDLPSFNGAGLHTSISAQLGDSTRNVDDALRTVWASLWNLRAYDEREHANIEQLAALMGVLVHEQFGGEAAQGVAISRNMLDVTRDDSYTIDTQIGEANVTNPAPGVITEQLLYSLPPTWMDVRYQTLSSLTGGQKILLPSDLDTLSCALGAVHNHFRPLLDPGQQNRLFAMQIEFKFERDRTLVVKQARPQPFGHLTLPTDCR